VAGPDGSVPFPRVQAVLAVGGRSGGQVARASGRTEPQLRRGIGPTEDGADTTLVREAAEVGIGHEVISLPGDVCSDNRRESVHRREA
jgi:hypothetical protein